VKVLDLFCGAGGITKGLQMAGHFDKKGARLIVKLKTKDF